MGAPGGHSLGTSWPTVRGALSFVVALQFWADKPPKRGMGPHPNKGPYFPAEQADKQNKR